MAFWNKKNAKADADFYMPALPDAEERWREEKRAKLVARTGMDLATMGILPPSTLRGGTPAIPPMVAGFDTHMLLHISRVLQDNNMSHQDLVKIVETYCDVKRRTER